MTLGMFDNTLLQGFLGTGSPLEMVTNPTSWWDQFKNGRTNQVNEDIANKNLRFQKETQDYNEALQQQIFDRADTAYQRTVDDMAKAGINPLTMNNPNETGTAIPQEARHNDFQMSDIGMLGMISPMMELMNGVNNLNSSGVQRDKLRSEINLQKADEMGRNLENERTMLENMVFANKNGITKNSDGSYSMPDFSKKEQDFNLQNYETGEATRRDKSASASRNERENAFQEQFGTHDESPREEKILTAVENQVSSGKAFETTKNALKNSPVPFMRLFGNALDLADKTANKISNAYENSKKKKSSKNDEYYKGSKEWKRAQDR